jgi:TPP-dependent indolepyruvate ferredoxin oxidoreductase alpha subunit
MPVPTGQDVVTALRAAEALACAYATQQGTPITSQDDTIADLQAQLTAMTGQRNAAVASSAIAQTAMTNALAKLQADKAADATADAARDAAIALLGG